MPRLHRRQSPNFTKTETDEMEDLYKELGDKTLCQDFCEKLAKKFSHATNRSPKPSFQWEQVQAWFEKKQQTCKSEVVVLEEEPEMISPKKELDDPPTVSNSNDTPNISVVPKGFATCVANVYPCVEDEQFPDISDLEFEAKSFRDDAWYDVAFFLTHRILVSTGEHEVRVRFAGFGAEEDEWVNMKTGIRERSLPLESNECHKVNVGDLVLCFQVNEDQELYFDAHVLEIERKLHDIRGCRCLFLVRYDHDNTEEKVQLRRLCRRPSQ